MLSIFKRFRKFPDNSPHVIISLMSDDIMDFAMALTRIPEQDLANIDWDTQGRRVVLDALFAPGLALQASGKDQPVENVPENICLRESDWKKVALVCAAATKSGFRGWPARIGTRIMVTQVMKM